MPPSKRKRSALSLEEGLNEIKKKRTKAKKLKKSAIDKNWIEIDTKTQNFIYSQLSIKNEFVSLSLNRTFKKYQIFLRLYSEKLINLVLVKTKAVNPKAFLLPNGRQFILSLGKIYKFLAIKIRIQAIQNGPKENQKNKDAQRKAYQEAKFHYDQKYPLNKAPGINILEKLNSNFFIRPDQEKDLTANLLSCITSLGQYVAGDEKLFHFTGRSNWVRLCPNKPGRVGIWNYELCAKVSCII